MVNLKEIAQKGTQQKSRIFMSEYKYSSFTDYFHMDRPESKILNKDKLLFDVVDMPAIDEMFAILSQKATRENPQGEPFVF
jgi:lysine/ornithine N-monooxygenase